MSKLEMLTQNLDRGSLEDTALKSFLGRLIAFVEKLEASNISPSQTRLMTDPPPPDPPKKKDRPSPPEDENPTKFKAEMNTLSFPHSVYKVQTEKLLAYAEELYSTHNPQT